MPPTPVARSTTFISHSLKHVLDTYGTADEQVAFITRRGLPNSVLMSYAVHERIRELVARSQDACDVPTLLDRLDSGAWDDISAADISRRLRFTPVQRPADLTVQIHGAAAAELAGLARSLADTHELGGCFDEIVHGYTHGKRIVDDRLGTRRIFREITPVFDETHEPVRVTWMSAHNQVRVLAVSRVEAASAWLWHEQWREPETPTESEGDDHGATTRSA